MHQYKPPKEGLPLVPLTDEEKSHLQTVYGSRLRYFLLTFLVLVLNALYNSIGLLSNSSQSREASIIALSVSFVILSACGLLFFRRIYPYKKDLKLGQKEKVSYTIIRKSHFPMTNQYYFSFDNPDYMHYEVDADLFYSMQEGDSVVIYRGRYSKHVFEKDARFTFM